MRIIKWILICALLGGIYLGWTHSGEKNLLPEYLERTKKVVSLRSHVQSRLNRQNYVMLEQIPLNFQQALIAVEDNRFYQHGGVDIEAVLRAILVNIQSGELKEGGSTISQQLVKNLFLSQDRTWSRKALEIPLTLLMEHEYSKKEILEMYVNTIYFGAGAYGIKEAAQTYFNKPPRNLSLAESALIAGLPAAPSVYSPHANPDMAVQRQKIVLAAMVRHGYISSRQAADAQRAPFKFSR